MEGELRGLFEQSLGFLTGIALVASGKPPALCAGVVLLGVVYARNLEFVHQCLHNTAFSSRRLNRSVGTLLALPMLVSFEQWRREHVAHHRDVRVEGFEYRLDRLGTKRELFLHLLMIRHYAASLRGIVLLRPRYRVLLTALLTTAVLSLVIHSPLPILAWLLPLPVAAVVHTHIELPEHLGCICESADASQNSRIVRAGRLATWFVHYNNYHALHHWRPGLPNRALPKAYDRHRSRFVHTTYRAFYRDFYAGFLAHRSRTGSAGGQTT